MISLSDRQLDIITQVAVALPVEKRSDYLQRIAAALAVRHGFRFTDARPLAPLIPFGLPARSECPRNRAFSFDNLSSLWRARSTPTACAAGAHRRSLARFADMERIRTRPLPASRHAFRVAA